LANIGSLQQPYRPPNIIAQHVDPKDVDRTNKNVAVVSDYTCNALNVALQGNGSVDQCKEACESETEVSDASVLSGVELFE
jgi:hypothetical protein